MDCVRLLAGYDTGMIGINQVRRLLQSRPKRRDFLPIRESPGGQPLFSGGIDALASVRWNRLKYPTEHRSFRDGILVYGLEIYHPEAFEYVRRVRVSGDAGLTLIPVYTNVRYLDDDWTFLGKRI